MIRKVSKFIMLFCLMMILIGCQSNEQIQYNRYQETIFDTFDTVTQVIGYAESEEEFNTYVEKIHERLQELHKFYDIYNTYEGINNVKTINDNAGIKPVKVDREIIDFILFSKEWYEKTDGQVNIAMGSVLRIWHQYRQDAEYDPQNAKLPPMEDLLDAAKHTDIAKVIVDVENSTVYLEDEKMRLDVGALAKGYATEIVALEIMEEGLKSGILSPGGNIRVLGKPLDGIRQRWGIGIQNPDKSVITTSENILDTVYLNNASVVSSGDYQRYYIVDGKTIHHLIDPTTLMPGDYYRAVTVVTEDSGIGDALSTAAFLMPYEKSRRLIENYHGAEAVWVMLDGEIEATDGMKEIMRSHGATATE